MTSMLCIYSIDDLAVTGTGSDYKRDSCGTIITRGNELFSFPYLFIQNAIMRHKKYYVSTAFELLFLIITQEAQMICSIFRHGDRK